MSQLPRVEITDKAFKALKIETALSGMNQKEALEALVLRGASSRTLALVEEKPLMDVEEKPQNVKVEVMDEKHVVSTSMSPEARPILEEIRRELEANHEPTLAELADRFKVPAQTISKAISPFGIRAQETKRGGVAGRYFTRAMRGQIEEILSKS